MRPVSSAEFADFQRSLGSLRTGITDDRSQRYETNDNRLSFFQAHAAVSKDHPAYVAWVLLSKHYNSLTSMVMKMRADEDLVPPPGEHILSTVADVMNYVEFIGKMIEDYYDEQEGELKRPSYDEPEEESKDGPVESEPPGLGPMVYRILRYIASYSWAGGVPVARIYEVFSSQAGSEQIRLILSNSELLGMIEKRQTPATANRLFVTEWGKKAIVEHETVHGVPNEPKEPEDGVPVHYVK